MKKKALVLFSGGLDSLLVIRMLQDQGFNVIALTYETPFFKSKKARDLAEFYGFEIIVKDISDPHFNIVKNPRFGYGKNMNPCVDCHGLMFKIARSIADEMGISVIASGEVLGQRPFSQNKDALMKVRMLAGTDILMPLSAKLLEETHYERQGLVDRNRFHSIKGKSREEQLQLIKKYKLDKFSSPGGGCILTAKEYSEKFKELLFTFSDKVQPFDAEIIKYGRCKIFEIGGNKCFAIMGRNHSDNEELLNLSKSLNENYLLINFVEFAGPRLVLMNFGQKVKYDQLVNVVKWMQDKVPKAKGSKELLVKINCAGKEEERKFSF